MKGRLHLKLILLFSVLLLCETYGQERILYICPDLGFRFTSETRWINDKSCQQPGELTLKNSNSNIFMSIWRADSVDDLTAYLTALASGNGLVISEQDISRIESCSSFTLLCASGREMQCPYRYIFAGLNLGKGILVVRIKCPEECYPDHILQVNTFLKSLLVNT